MRDYDDVPTIVIERDTGGGFGSFVLGALVGAGLALLLAPQSGEATQEEIRDRARRLRNAAEDRVRDAQRQLEERLETARQEVQHRVDSVRHAVDTGRKAAVDARRELETRLEQSKAAYRAGVDAAKTSRTAGAPVATGTPAVAEAGSPAPNVPPVPPAGAATEGGDGSPGVTEEPYEQGGDAESRHE